MKLCYSDCSVFQRVLSSRWMLSILDLARQDTRFGDIQASLPGLSRGVLATQLQELLTMGLLTQKKYTCFPPRVEYRATEKGLALMGVLSRLPIESTEP